jgi:2-keto-4-pentenoate hydratase/2-oxohepta-3-ene-1,7-dioic acid hydratase in catechol pathway
VVSDAAGQHCTQSSLKVPSKIVCVGRNYSDHAKELGNDVPKEPLIFLKPPSSIIKGGDPVYLPRESSQVEFEGEIGIVVGKRLRQASADEAAGAVGAIVAANDVTARDLQRAEPQWTRAKGFDSFCPLGEPSTKHPPLDQLTVITRVNGAERQRASSADMVFSIPVVLAYISQVMTLEPGDLVLTGTPAGVGILRSGDVVEVDIPGVGSVKNPVAAIG